MVEHQEHFKELIAISMANLIIIWLFYKNIKKKNWDTFVHIFPLIQTYQQLIGLKSSHEPTFQAPVMCQLLPSDTCAGSWD